MMTSTEPLAAIGLVASSLKRTREIETLYKVLLECIYI